MKRKRSAAVCGSNNFLVFSLYRSMFNDEQIAQIKKLKFSQIIQMVSNIDSGLIPSNAFLLPTTGLLFDLFVLLFIEKKINSFHFNRPTE